MTPTEEIDRIHIVERMSFVLRGKCTPESSDRDKLIALYAAGFHERDIVDHFPAAEKRAGLVPNRRSWGSIVGEQLCDSRGQSPN